MKKLKGVYYYKIYDQLRGRGDVQQAGWGV